VAVLAALSGIAILLVPAYFRNLQLRSFLRETAPVSDEILRRDLLNQSRLLGLDIAPERIQIHHSPAGSPTDVRYVIRVSMPLYTVDLHFSSKVGEARR
jgi:hypothetical protein